MLIKTKLTRILTIPAVAAVALFAAAPQQTASAEDVTYLIEGEIVRHTQ